MNVVVDVTISGTAPIQDTFPIQNKSGNAFFTSTHNNTIPMYHIPRYHLESGSKQTFSVRNAGIRHREKGGAASQMKVKSNKKWRTYIRIISTTDCFQLWTGVGSPGNNRETTARLDRK